MSRSDSSVKYQFLVYMFVLHKKYRLWQVSQQHIKPQYCKRRLPECYLYHITTISEGPKPEASYKVESRDVVLGRGSRPLPTSRGICRVAL